MGGVFVQKAGDGRNGWWQQTVLTTADIVLIEKRDFAERELEVAELKRKFIALKMAEAAVMLIWTPKALNHWWTRLAGKRLISCIVTEFGWTFRRINWFERICEANLVPQNKAALVWMVQWRKSLIAFTIIVLDTLWIVNGLISLEGDEMRKDFACIQTKFKGGKQWGKVRSTIMLPGRLFKRREGKFEELKFKTNVICEGRRLRKCWRMLNEREVEGICM
ncbi:MAG: hypothetical protein ACTS5F_00840 [Candidatus Hodgkinia cicadicola]